MLIGDCLEILPTLPAASVDMVLADPPYGVTRNEWDRRIDFVRLWAELRRVFRLARLLPPGNDTVSVMRKEICI